MPRPVELSMEAMVAPPVPRAAVIKSETDARKPKEVTPKVEAKEPLQVRWPASKVKAAKLAAIQFDFPTVSDFMLACFDDFMQSRVKG